MGNISKAEVTEKRIRAEQALQAFKEAQRVYEKKKSVYKKARLDYEEISVAYVNQKTSK